MALALPRNRTFLLGILACISVATFLTLLTVTRERATVWPSETLIPTLSGEAITIPENEQNSLTARLVGKDVTNIEIHKFEAGEMTAGLTVLGDVHILAQCANDARVGTFQSLYGIGADKTKLAWGYAYDGGEATRKAQGKTGADLFPLSNFWVSRKQIEATPSLAILRNFQGSLAGKMIYLMSDEAIPESGCLDTDQDGKGDPRELAQWNATSTNTDLFDADTDNDGLVDGYGDEEKGTDPLKADTDNDGVQDGTELGVETGHSNTDAAIFKPDLDPPSKTDPLVADSDGDILKEGEEDLNANGRRDANETNPSDRDSDEDGIADNTEKTVTQTNPTTIDTDGDGIQDGTELSYIDVTCINSSASLEDAGALLVAQATTPNATLAVIPGGGTFAPGTNIPFDIVLDANTDIAAVEVKLLTKNLTLLSFDSTNPPSAFEMELLPPTQTPPDVYGVSTVTFSRLSINTGKQGQDLQVLRLVFTASVPGTATLDFDTMTNATQVVALETSEPVALTVVNGSYTIGSPNVPPTLTVPGAQTVQALQTLTFTVTADDPDGGPGVLTLIAVNPPSGSTFAGIFFGSLLLMGGLGAMGFDRRKLLIAASIVAIALLVLILKTGMPISRFRGQLVPTPRTFTWTPAVTDVGTHTVTFEAGDGAATTRADVVITVTPANQAPTVFAGPDQTITLPSPAILDGTAADDGLPQPFSTIWTLVSGPGTVTFESASAIDTTATFSVAGTYVLRLTADDSALQTSDETTVTVNPPANQPPTADAGTDQIITLPVTTANLDGTATDDNLPTGTLTTSWSMVSGPGTVTFGDAAALDTTATFSVEGAYVLRLTADDSMLSASDTVTMTVVPAIAPPTLIIQEPQNASTIVGSTVQVLYSAGGTLTGVHHIHLGLDAPSAPDRDLDFDGSFLYTNVAEGAHTITAYLARADHSRIGEIVSVSFTVVYNLAPTVSAGADQMITLPSSAILDGTAADDGLPNPPAALTSMWSMVSGPGTVTFGDASAVDTTATFSVDGTYVLRLMADDSALQTSDDLSITVNPVIVTNQAPSINAGPDQTITLPAFVALDGTVTDDGLPNPPGQVTTTWSMVSGPGTVTFGDASAIDTTATFSVEGTYVMRLMASDSVLSASDEITVMVNPALPGNQAPTVNAGADQIITLPTNLISLDGTATDDNLPAGTLTTSWSMVSGPGTVTFGDASAVDTTATFSTEGTYVLRLTADDSMLSASDTVQSIVRPSSIAHCIDPDTDRTIFDPDEDSATATNPLLADTDGGSLSDGAEDINHNGRVDAGEKDPLNPGDDASGH